MNELQIFNYREKEVRVVRKDNQDWWVAKDVCDVLDIINVTQAVGKLDDDERSMFNIGRQGEVNVINEPGLYKIILRSDKPEAKPFIRWITHEVIPSIRKTGSYSTVKIPDKKELDLRIKAEREARLMAKEKRLSAQFFEEVIDKYGSKLSTASIQQAIFEISSMLFGKGIIERPVLESKHYQATDIAKELGISANMVGRMANQHGLKTEEYGKFIMDKSRSSNKQVQSFLYSQKGKDKIIEILSSPLNG